MKKKLFFWLLSFFILILVWYIYRIFNNTTISCPYVIWNTSAYFFNKGRWKGIRNIDSKTFTFLYKARNNDILYGTPCYFKDKNFVYRNDQALFSGFDYTTFQIVTGKYKVISNEPKLGPFVDKWEEDTCVWGCFEDKDAVYYDEWSSWPEEMNGFIRDTTKIFPNTSEYDLVRNKVYIKK